MLVAGAAMSLLAPVGVHASDSINFEGMNDYKRSTKKSSSNKRFDHKTFVNPVNEELAELEVQPNNFEAGSF